MQDDGEEFIPEDEGGNPALAVKRIRGELAQCRKEKQEYLDGWQRAKADFINAKRAWEEEKKSLVSRAGAKAALALIPALDSLEAARAHGGLPPQFAPIEKQLRDGFAELGLKAIEPHPGEAFDPREHEALKEEESDDPALHGMIASVLRPGWKRDEWVIRPALVTIGTKK